VWASLTDQAIALFRPLSAGYPSAAPEPHFPLHPQRVSCQRAAPSVISSHALAFGRPPAPSRRFQNPPAPPAVVTGTPLPALRRRPRLPQLRRLQPKMVPENVRVLIVWNVVHHVMPCSEAARLFGCDPSSVYRFKATYLSTGELWPNGERRNTHRDNISYDEAFKLALVEIIEERPELFLREIGDIIRALQQLPAWPRELNCSTSTIDRVLRAVGWTHKRVITHYKERNDDLRVRWARMALLFPSSAFVSCDESHVDGSSSYRRSSWVPRGQRSHRLLPSPRNRPRCTVTVGISSTGAVLAEYVTKHPDGGSGQTEYDWLMFILILLPNTNPDFGAAAASHSQQISSISLIDNAPIHTTRVGACIRAHGRRVVRLPPYSPDFAPVEMVFSKVKERWPRSLFRLTWGAMDGWPCTWRVCLFLPRIAVVTLRPVEST